MVRHPAPAGPGAANCLAGRAAFSAQPLRFGTLVAGESGIVRRRDITSITGGPRQVLARPGQKHHPPRVMSACRSRRRSTRVALSSAAATARRANRNSDTSRTRATPSDP